MKKEVQFKLISDGTHGSSWPSPIYQRHLNYSLAVTQAPVRTDPIHCRSYTDTGHIRHHEGMYFSPRWPSWRPDGQYLLGAVLPGTWHPAGWTDAQ